MPSILCSMRRLHTTSVSNPEVNEFLSVERKSDCYCSLQQVIFSFLCQELVFHSKIISIISSNKKVFNWIMSNKGAWK